jgi:hypothetical protein
MKGLYNLAYISRNMINGAKEDIEKEVQKILQSAQKNNPRINVTGALLYSGGWFCQVIEGDYEVLDELFETIQMDERHGEVTVLHFEPLEARGFSEWAMAFAGIQDEQPFDIEGVLATKDQIKMHEAGKSLIQTLDKLVTAHQSADC